MDAIPARTIIPVPKEYELESKRYLVFQLLFFRFEQLFMLCFYSEIFFFVQI